MDSVKLDPKKFYPRLSKIHKYFINNFKNLDCLVFPRGKFIQNDTNCEQTKTSNLHEYILGYDFTESLIVITKKRIIFFLASKKFMLIENMLKPKEITLEIKLFLRNPNGNNEETLEKIFDLVIKDNNNEFNKMKIGMLNEKGIGNLINEFWNFLKTKENNYEIFYLPQITNEFFIIKDNEELENIKISSKFACTLLNYLNQKFENIIDNEKKISHFDICNDIKKISENSNFQKKFLEKNKNYKINFNFLEINNLIIQSGGNYNLSNQCENDKNYLNSDVIICKASTKYHDYNSNIIRTYMIDADKEQQKNYKILLEAFNKLENNLKEGEIISKVYENVLNEIISRDSNLIENLCNNFGNGIGLEFNNEKLIINNENKEIIKKGMVFNIKISFENLKKNDFVYSLQIADTIVVKSSNEIENFTSNVSKELSEIHYNFSDDEENSEKNNEFKDEIANIIKNADYNRIETRHGKKTNDEKLKNVEKRKEHQMILLKKKNENLRNKMLNHSSDLKEEIGETKINLSNVKSYENKNNFPSNLSNTKIFIDKKNFTILLPIFKKIVPFHIALIKNATKSEDGNLTVLRINFITPISQYDFGEIKYENPVFIRDISYKHKDNKIITDLMNDIRELIKNYKIKQQEIKEKNDLVKQEHLILLKGKNIQLRDVIIRPGMSNKKTIGNLEAHQNGFRFFNQKGDKCEIIYKNIKHAFLQPCENELITLIHFHLKNQIMLGKKKTLDIQFYKEAGSQADDLNIRHRGNDYEEYEIELKERQHRERINNEFYKFTKNVQELNGFEFDVPFREMEFTGVPNRSNVVLLPTKYCLVSLVETPVFVITLSEVDIVYFERVSQSLKNFDMTFIFKDLSKQPHRITAIPMEHLDMLKTWLDDNDILYGEGLYNIHWPKMLQKIKSDPKQFLDEGGWNFIQENDDSESSSESREKDSDYNMDEEEEDEDDSSDEEYEEEDVESESKGSGEGESALSEKGLSWEELEKKAIKSDKEHAKKYKDEDEKKGKKKGRK